ncbi:MAG: FtsK/SpoIIIE domain-containing protein [Acidimicrobiales bacterium]
MSIHVSATRIRLAVAGPGFASDVVLDMRGGNPDVGELLAVVAPDIEAVGLVVDGGFVPAARALRDAGLHDGALVEVATARRAARPSSAAGRSGALVVVEGLDAGRRIAISPGTHIVGRGAALDLRHPSVSREHAALVVGASGSVAIGDLGSRNGTWRGRRAIGRPLEPLAPGELVRIGALDIAVRAARGDDRPLRVERPHAATTPFNRQPRPAPDVELAAIVTLPAPPRAPSNHTPFSVAAFALPLLLAVLLVKLAGNPTFALFALLSPVMIASTAIEQRRRGARMGRRAAAGRRSDLVALASALEASMSAERDRRLGALPDLAEVTRWACAPSVRLWERRGVHGDFLRVRAGTGDVPWLPSLDGPSSAHAEDVESILASHRRLVDVPLELDLSAGGAVGVVGDRAAALAVARGIVVQAAVHQGPADLAIAVLTADEADRDWEWAKWLPHTRAVGGVALLARGRTEAAAIAEALVAAGSAPLHPNALVVVDGEQLLEGRRSPVRALLQGRAALSGIVVAASLDRLPAACTAVIELRGPDGLAMLRGARGDRTSMLVSGCALDVARDCARHLARFDDPELEATGAGLPSDVSLLELVSPPDQPLALAIIDSWAGAGIDARPCALLGVGLDGVIGVDLDHDGPHALIAGTTGSGKSELLRSLVAGLAARLPPEQLNFLLIDFKGGAAFDACARLPHCVGLVTDLDEHLAERALRCLEAELRHRELLLRSCAAADLGAYRRANGVGALPRLVVVVDEFATLKAEVPGFIDALVGVAQRGRSLGVHLVLATQRPAGAVSDNIRANTGLRIALRVHDAADATDVIGDAAAAAIPRARPGRAVVRFGPGELVAMQTARITGVPFGATDASIVITPFAFGSGDRRASSVEGDGATDLDALVGACCDAFEVSGAPLPRRPWTEPLPVELDLDDPELATPTPASDDIVFALADDPDSQRRHPHAWRLRDGNLLVWGIGGSGTSTVLASIALAAAARTSPARLHMYVISHGAGELAVLGELAHCGGVVEAADREREVRTLRMLRAELARRRSLRGEQREELPRLLLLLDGYSGFAAERADAAGMAVLDDLLRVFADGNEVGIHVAITADRVGAVPVAVSSLARQRLLLRLADAHDYGLAGVAGRALPRFAPGRGIDAESGRVVQVAQPRGGLDAAVRAIADRARSAPRARGGPSPIGVLPSLVGHRDVIGAARVGSRPWLLPIGIGERTLRPAGFELYEGEHALVAGPPRSGRSSALMAVARAFASAVPDGRIVAIAGPRSPLGAWPGALRTTDAAQAVSGLAARAGPTLLLVDDAELVEDPTGVLAALLTQQHADLVIVAAGRAETLRTAYGHWTRGLRRSKLGVLLQPDTDLDGELIGRVLPRRSPVVLSAGRGWLSGGGELEVVQLAT